MIRIGTAGWSYPDWEGRVYPSPKPRGFDPLAYLAHYFEAIEINSTFYRIPAATLTRSWAARVAAYPNFRFTAKLWQGFTHEGRASASDEAAFKRAMLPLQEAEKLGAVLMQFPYRFHHTAENRARLRQLARALGDFPLVVELRHRSWDSPSAYHFLRELGVGFCNIDQPQVSYSLGLTHVVTGAVGYLRLHGRNAAMWFAEEADRDARYDYRYTAAELDELAAVVERLSQQAGDTYVIANNHFRGQAALNALELGYRLRRQPVQAPLPLLQTYPELQRLAAPAPR
jgi:uncharacterized protein YecE (DUF72 family)